MLSYVRANWWPYERAWIQTFLWGDSEHTVATGTVGVVGGDASTAYTPISATWSGGKWVIGE
jgi:hypothetical protein